MPTWRSPILTYLAGTAIISWQHLHFLADDKLLAGRVTRVTTPAKTGLQRALYDFEYELAAKPIQIRVDENVLNEFDYAPGNRWEATYVVRVTQQGQPPVEGLLLTSRELLAIDCKWDAQSREAAPATLDKWRLTKEYVRHGIMHILTGDHYLAVDQRPCARGRNALGFGQSHYRFHACAFNHSYARGLESH